MNIVPVYIGDLARTTVVVAASETRSLSGLVLLCEKVVVCLPGSFTEGIGRYLVSANQVGIALDGGINQQNTKQMGYYQHPY